MIDELGTEAVQSSQPLSITKLCIHSDRSLQIGLPRQLIYPIRLI
jgi:hypothetical protein